MRRAALAGLMALTAFPLAAQQVQDNGRDATVSQPGFTVPSSGGTFEVTPLAPPSPTTPGPDQPAPGIAAEGNSGAGQEGVPGTGASGPRASGPRASGNVAGGMILGALDSGGLLIEGGAGVDSLTKPPSRQSGAAGLPGGMAPDDGTGLMRPGGIAVPIKPPETLLRPGVRLRELDKMTGETETFDIAVGETKRIDRLKIRPEACRSPESNDTHGTTAFLKVWDVREPSDEAFSGWMFAQSPALSAMDHPRYDLWVISCTTAEGAASADSE